MKKLLPTFKKHLSIREVATALAIMVIITGFSSFFIRSFIEIGDALSEQELKDGHANSFFIYYEVEPTQMEFPIGQQPSFYFTNEYFKTGHIEGKSVLRCDHFRSDQYYAEGYIDYESVNVLFTGDPFVFGGDLPDFETSCYLRSIITLCEEEYGICKTQVTNSLRFNFIKP